MILSVEIANHAGMASARSDSVSSMDKDPDTHMKSDWMKFVTPIVRQ